MDFSLDFIVSALQWSFLVGGLLEGFFWIICSRLALLSSLSYWKLIQRGSIQRLEGQNLCICPFPHLDKISEVWHFVAAQMSWLLICWPESEHRLHFSNVGFLFKRVKVKSPNFMHAGWSLKPARAHLQCRPKPMQFRLQGVLGHFLQT